MKLSAPKKGVFWISVILIVLGLVGVLVHTIPVLSVYGYWFTFAGAVLLSLGCLLKGF